MYLCKLCRVPALMIDRVLKEMTAASYHCASRGAAVCGPPSSCCFVKACQHSPLVYVDLRKALSRCIALAMRIEPQLQTCISRIML